MSWTVRFYKWDGRRKREKLWVQKTVELASLGEVLTWVGTTLAASTPDYLSQLVAIRLSTVPGPKVPPAPVLERQPLSRLVA